MPESRVLYIGQGGDLHRRLKQLARYGASEPVGHWGGRYLWQLADCRELLVAWRRDADPLRGEAELLTAFFRAYGRLPFANLR